jgi:hypothetical protein
MSDFNRLIIAVEEVYGTFKFYSRTVHAFKDDERLIPYIEEYYGLEYNYENAYDAFMENPCMITYVKVNDVEEELWDYMDNTLQPKITNNTKRYDIVTDEIIINRI